LTRVIGVISGKGGVGKTTVVANLGTALSSNFDKDVIVIDCNITTSHLGLYLGVYYHPVSLNQVLTGDASIHDAIYEYHIGKLKIIPASLSLRDLKGVDISRLKHVIKDLFGKTDIIILDSAPGLGREATATIQASDEVIFVTTPFVPSTMDLIKSHQLVNEIGAKSLGVVLNMVGEEKYELTAKEVEQLAELPVISSIPVDKNVLRSLAAKIPVVTFNPKSPASREFIKLAANLIGKEHKPVGFFSQFFSIFRPKPKTIF
jgi:cell division ATPase MinD